MILTYLWRHGRLPDLIDAPRFTELVQRRKLYDRDTRHTALMDKLAAKRAVAAKLGPGWVTPTIWQGFVLPEHPISPLPIIVKARHGCNQYAVLRHEPSPRQWSALQSSASRWMALPYGKWLDEWAYEGVPRGLLAEPLLGAGPGLPVDYKIYVFGGHATHVQVHLDRGKNHHWVLHDRAFRPLVTHGQRCSEPRSLGAMLEAAEALGAGHEFIRIDFYEVDGAPRFGEFCLYPGSGLDPFAADWIDFELGKLWHGARAPVRPSRLERLVQPA
ncbi:hypothetical protein GGQ88_001669 [Novosphingobium hassiacum]|uniref:Polysaccharide biosynthesis protein n=1 Tax=Novosphingobium hassiacum TaxID=173676 RepID=A0A7W6EVK6_9SPHN|nr:hypothetical protein [Novosphingobium hassiacum]